MKTQVVGWVVFLMAGWTAATPCAASPATALPGNDSLRHEVRHAAERGRAWLETKQNTNGSWSSADHPALTALVLTALAGPSADKSPAPSIDKGYAYLLSCAQPDGGIYKESLQTYNTSVVLTALAMRNRPQDQDVIRKARRFLIGLQVNDSQAEGTNAAYRGGIGYGKTEKHPDLSNTVLALEALYHSHPATQDIGGAKAPDLDWKAAISFVQNCQNLPGYNSQSWASDDAQNKGGFIYTPGRSNAGTNNLPSGRVALRSYGSMSYAGLLSYIYADMKLDDPRVSAALDWLRNNYTVEENPGMGQQGLFYYYVLMAKALTFAGVDTLEMKDGRKINWREDLALKLINLQQPDGSWLNGTGRWWEKDSVLDTADAMTALEILESKL